MQLDADECRRNKLQAKLPHYSMTKGNGVGFSGLGTAQLPTKYNRGPARISNTLEIYSQKLLAKFIYYIVGI
jgi:hypothetical protein